MALADSNYSKLFANDYDAIADVYAQLRTARYYDKDIIRALPKHAHAVLDLGCADGEFSLSIAESVGRVVGIDVSDKMLKNANTKLKARRSDLAASTPPRDINVRFCKSSVESLDESVAKRGMYDAIVANRVLHHCHEDMYATVRELRELLALGGKLIVLDLNVTGDNAKGRVQKFLKMWYRVLVCIKGSFGCIRDWRSHTRWWPTVLRDIGQAKADYDSAHNTKRRLRDRLMLTYRSLVIIRTGAFGGIRDWWSRIRWLPTVLRDLRQERAILASDPWKQHLSHEPNYHWKQIYRAMKACGLSPRAKRRNGRFMLIVGQLREHPPSRSRFMLVMHYVFLLTIGACIGMGLTLLWQHRGAGHAVGESIFVETLKAFFSTSYVQLEEFLSYPFGLFLVMFSLGCTVGAWLWGRHLWTKWHYGPVEERSGIGIRFAAWLIRVLRIDGGSRAMDLWAYYRSKTNCRALKDMSECSRFLKEHFGSVEGQIWIHRSDLRGLIDDGPFEELYQKVIDKEYSIDEVRIILEDGFLTKKNKLPKKDREKLKENLGKLYRRSIIKYRYLKEADYKDESIIPKELYKDFNAYTSHETFIFYTEGEALPQHQAVCVSRCAVNVHNDQDRPLRIVVTAMRNWSKRQRAEKDPLDPEPLEKYMNKDLQRIFQRLFEDGSKFKPLYNDL